MEVTIGRSSRVGDGGLVVRVNDGRRSVEVPRGFASDDLRRLITTLESC